MVGHALPTRPLKPSRGRHLRDLSLRTLETPCYGCHEGEATWKVSHKKSLPSASVKGNTYWRVRGLCAWQNGPRLCARYAARCSPRLGGSRRSLRTRRPWPYRKSMPKHPKPKIQKLPNILNPIPLTLEALNRAWGLESVVTLIK